jgi:hypothetical protein
MVHAGDDGCLAVSGFSHVTNDTMMASQRRFPRSHRRSVTLYLNPPLSIKSGPILPCERGGDTSITFE